MNDSGKRYIGLDVHKHYLIALGMDENLAVVLPARRVELTYLEAWMRKTITKQDEVVLEMTTPPPGSCMMNLSSTQGQ
jgi:type II secretory pathway component PulK